MRNKHFVCCSTIFKNGFRPGSKYLVSRWFRNHVSMCHSMLHEPQAKLSRAEEMVCWCWRNLERIYFLLLIDFSHHYNKKKSLVILPAPDDLSRQELCTGRYGRQNTTLGDIFVKVFYKFYKFYKMRKWNTSF